VSERTEDWKESLLEGIVLKELEWGENTHTVCVSYSTQLSRSSGIEESSECCFAMCSSTLISLQHVITVNQPHSNNKHCKIIQTNTFAPLALKFILH